MVAEPELGLISPAIIPSMVDFPQPLGPRRQTNSLVRTDSWIFSSAWTCPRRESNTLETSVSAMTASPVSGPEISSIQIGTTVFTVHDTYSGFGPPTFHAHGVFISTSERRSRESSR